MWHREVFVLENYKIYESIARRSRGDIYIGVVGPARAGKSSFIRRFMDLLVVPQITDPYERGRVLDEMPQSGSGRTVTTTEPKFVPMQAFPLDMPDGMSCRVRLVDCVGYMVPGALGHMEDGEPRLVGTPWDDEKIPFVEAAEIGTRRVIEEHSTIGIVITTDGTIGDIDRENYIEAEERVISQLKELGKPFIILVNSVMPADPAAQQLAADLRERFGVPAVPVDCVKMPENQLEQIMQTILYQFPVDEIAISLPGFVEGLAADHWLKQALLAKVAGWMGAVDTAADLTGLLQGLSDGEITDRVRLESLDMGTGRAVLDMSLVPGLFYKIIGEIMDTEVKDDAHFFRLLQDFAFAKKSFDKISDALNQVEATEYGIVQPKLQEMILSEPEIFQQGGRYGVRIVSRAPSLHIIKTDITTEVAPLVGSQEHAEALLAQLLAQYETEPEKIWETNIFGRTVYDMTAEQMQSKLAGVPENIRGKIQKSLQKICDDGKEYFICIIV